jgi:hypothetical protein
MADYDRLFEVSWTEVCRQVREELGKRKGDWDEIAGKAKVTYPWLRTFYAASHPRTDPLGVGRLAAVLGLPIRVSVIEISQQKAPSGRANRSATAAAARR